MTTAQQDIIQQVLHDSSYRLSVFEEHEVDRLRSRGHLQGPPRYKEIPFVRCIIRDKDIQLKPEEVVRQLYAAKLINNYGYPKERLTVEHLVNFGQNTGKADIVITDKDRPDSAYIIVEIKKPKLVDGKKQLRSYCNATGAPIGVWTNGQQISHYNRKDPNCFEDITDIPKAGAEFGGHSQ